jgi:hypothetical protein
MVATALRNFKSKVGGRMNPFLKQNCDVALFRSIPDRYAIAAQEYSVSHIHF